MKYYASIDQVELGDQVKLIVQPYAYGVVNKIDHTTGVLILQSPVPHGSVFVHFSHVTRVDHD